MMTLIDEYTRQCLRIRVARQLISKDVITVLSEAIEKEEIPGAISVVTTAVSSLLIKCSCGCPTKTSRRSIAIRAVPGYRAKRHPNEPKRE